MNFDTGQGKDYQRQSQRSVRYEPWIYRVFPSLNFPLKQVVLPNKWDFYRPAEAPFLTSVHVEETSSFKPAIKRLLRVVISASLTGLDSIVELGPIGTIDVVSSTRDVVSVNRHSNVTAAPPCAPRLPPTSRSNCAHFHTFPFYANLFTEAKRAQKLLFFYISAKINNHTSAFRQIHTRTNTKRRLALPILQIRQDGKPRFILPAG